MNKKSNKDSPGKLTPTSCIANFRKLCKQRKISRDAKFLYYTLVGLANDYFWNLPIMATENQILEEMGICHRTFIKARKELRELGLISYTSERPFPCKYYLLDISGKLAQEKDQADNKRKHEENEKELDSLYNKWGKRKQGNAPA